MSLVRGVNKALLTTTVSLANSAAAGTTINVDIPLPSKVLADAKYLIIVTNPSTETALDIKVKNKVTLGGTPKYPEIATNSVLVNTPGGKGFVVEGFLLGEGGRLAISNPTAVGLSGAFTADVHVIQI